MSNIGIIISLFFPPSFVISLYYFDFNSVAFVYCGFMLIYLIVSFLFKQDLKSVSTPLIYFSFVLIAYLFSSIEFIKMIPALISTTFFFVFLTAYLQKKELILSITKKFYKKELTDEKEVFLAASDIYWASIIFINTLFQIGLVFYENNELWAFYSSVGWYIYLAVALLFQVLYEKVFISSKADVL